jgi:hypothetical protein
MFLEHRSWELSEEGESSIEDMEDNEKVKKYLFKPTLPGRGVKAVASGSGMAYHFFVVIDTS